MYHRILFHQHGEVELFSPWLEEKKEEEMGFFKNVLLKLQA